MNRYLFLYDYDYDNIYQFIESENAKKALVYFYGFFGGGLLDIDDFETLVSNNELEKGVELFNRLTNDKYVTLKYIMTEGQYLYSEGD